MTTEKGDEFHNLTFSQREGRAPLPEVMKLEHVPWKFRQLAWHFVDSAIRNKTHFDFDMYDNEHSRGIDSIIWSYRFEIQLEPHDDISHSTPSKDREVSRKLLLDGEYHDVLTFVEYILRHEECSDKLYASLKHGFDQSPIAYYAEKIDGQPTIIPRINREAGEATRRAIQTISEGVTVGAATHLRQAAERINARQYADSIADSIHAVESVARVIDPKASGTLGPALKSLEKTGLLKHPVLTEAFNKLYGYTNDEQGIRHALLERNAADVGQDEAVFMFSACASFAAYLTDKHRQVGEREADGG